MNNKKILWITRTALFTALLIVMQAATSPLGNIIITGSIVNYLLIVSVMTCGFTSGLSVAFISPIAAKLLAIGPLWSLIPFIIAGNTVLVLSWYFVGNRSNRNRLITHLSALIISAISKFLVLYIGIVKVAIPFIVDLPEKQATVISNMFSVPQLITATIGGVIAVMTIPTLKKAIQLYK